MDTSEVHRNWDNQSLLNSSQRLMLNWSKQHFKSAYSVHSHSLVCDFLCTSIPPSIERISRGPVPMFLQHLSETEANIRAFINVSPVVCMWWCALPKGGTGSGGNRDCLFLRWGHACRRDALPFRTRAANTGARRVFTGPHPLLHLLIFTVKMYHLFGFRNHSHDLRKWMTSSKGDAGEDQVR